MNNLSSILAFILAEQTGSIDYASLTKLCVNSSAILTAHSLTPFHSVVHEGSLYSFSLEYLLGQFAKKELVALNGCVVVKDKDGLRRLSNKIDFDLQLKIKSAIKNAQDVYLESSAYCFDTASTPIAPKKTIFTAGYEGKTCEAFIINLLSAGVRTLVDVRKNAVSRRFGFSKKQISRACETLAISYVHIPELGIPSESRQSLSTQADYEKLFAGYAANILPKYEKEQENLLEIIDSSPAALMCFEADYQQCHRSHLAKSLSAKAPHTIVNI